MGYYTWYELELYNAEDKEDQILEHLNKEVPDSEWIGQDHNTWYDHDKEMTEFSKLYPEVIFELSGNGEDPDDQWTSRYLNGETEIKGIEKYLPEFRKIRTKQEEEDGVILAIVGSRSFDNYGLLWDKMVEFMHERQIKKIISGGAKGADSLAKDYAEKNYIEFQEYLPDWDNLGKTAGPTRNAEMAAEADYVIAFWDGNSRGTKDMINASLNSKKVKQVIVVKYEQTKEQTNRQIQE